MVLSNRITLKLTLHIRVAQISSIKGRDLCYLKVNGNSRYALVSLPSNRIGTEHANKSDTSITFFGSSFITDHTGAKVQEMDRESSGVITHAFDLNAIDFERRSWGMFRDRLPTAYQRVLTLDGQLAG